MGKTYIWIVTAVAALAFSGQHAYAASLPEAADGAQAKVVRGTIYGEVKKVQPDAVIVEADRLEVRLLLHESTHVGPVKEGDQVVAYVTPGGTTTSIQPLDARWYR